VDEPEIDAVIVPGLAFDRAGGRLGYGEGYYDRFLEKLMQAKTPRAQFVGVAFDAQVVENVPMYAHDVPMDWLVTELGRTSP
jgi:5-formyltetrahydrofolate cyclo-ligase